MINVAFRVRRAVAEDHQQIASLMFHESNVHRHLDWKSPLEWLGSENYWVLGEERDISAVLACPEDPQDVAWIRLFGYDSHLPPAGAWGVLWEVARTRILTSRQKQAAAIVVKRWFQDLLVKSGFEQVNNIVLLEFRTEDFQPKPAGAARIRPMREDDLAQVAELDAQAFGPFWRNSLDALTRARAQAVYCSVAEDESGVIGYQISTGNMFGAHLARLGVRKEAQGRGIATSLAQDLIQNMDLAHSSRITVNTQEDNAASLALYAKLGFKRTGEYYPVLACKGPAA